jgi:hypothetical protein
MYTRSLFGFAALVCVSAAAALPARAASVINACITKQTGAVRIVQSVATCKSTETPIAWNAVGPQGPAGPPGQQGVQGVQGPPGTIPQNLTNLANDLSTTNGQAEQGPETFQSAACNSMNVGDIVLSVNGYGGGGSLPADGRLLTINSNTALFSLLGTTFGGDGVSNFALPDLRAITPKGLQYSICVSAIYPVRN